MAGIEAGYRKRLFGAVHAEAQKRGMDHDALHDLVKERFGCHSMADCTSAQLEGLYRGWTKKTIRRAAKLPNRGDRVRDRDTLVSAQEMIDLAAEFDQRGMTPEQRRTFVRRQLQGREEVRTRGDWAAVLCGLRGWRKRQAARGVDGQAARAAETE